MALGQRKNDVEVTPPPIERCCLRLREMEKVPWRDDKKLAKDLMELTQQCWPSDRRDQGLVKPGQEEGGQLVLGREQRESTSKDVVVVAGAPQLAEVQTP